MPVHRADRHATATSVPAYASSAVLPSPPSMPRRRCGSRNGGWAAYKIHPPTRWKDDIKVCEAVRRAVGDDYTIMLDSTWSYDYPAALRVGRAVEEMGFYWYEDPLADQDIYNYVKLKQQLSIPDHGHRVSADRPGYATSPGSCSRRPTICAATWR